jgi:predicted AlkP superfamily phosphohydrolase/phosphomutase
VATLESLDKVVGKLRETAERLASGRMYFVVVSDHGFVRIEAQLNLDAAFRRAGLLNVDDKGKITDWKATSWSAGGSAAIMLKDPSDAGTLATVQVLLKKLASDPANGIDRVLDANELHKRGGYPQASFLVNLKPGWTMGSALEGPVLSKIRPGGTHGALPDLPDLHAAFFVIGTGIPPGRSLGVIDMRDIAPTLAHLAGLSLPTADGKSLLP